MTGRLPWESPHGPSQAEPAAPAQGAPGRVKRTWYRPGLLAWLAFVAIIAVICGTTLLLLGSDRPLTFWYVVRASGFATYELLTISLLLGMFLAWRVRPFTGIWLVAEKLHPLVLLTAGVATGIHIVGMLKLDFPVQEALLPFTSAFRTVPLSLGVLSLYVGSLPLLSTYLMGLIGYKVWRVVHYTSFIAWGTALAHGVWTGHDTPQVWAPALYIAGAVPVGVFLVIMLVRTVNGAADRATLRAAGAEYR
jgi:predicted ferric reductase